VDAALRNLTIHRFLTILLVIDEALRVGFVTAARAIRRASYAPSMHDHSLESHGPPLNILGLEPFTRHSEVSHPRRWEPDLHLHRWIR